MTEWHCCSHLKEIISSKKEYFWGYYFTAIFISKAQNLSDLKGKFEFQEQAAYHQQMFNNEHCKSLSQKIQETNHNILTGGNGETSFSVLIILTVETGYLYMTYHLAAFQVKPHKIIRGRKTCY